MPISRWFIAFFCFVLAVYAFGPGHGGVNQLTRFAVTDSIVSRGVFSIDGLAPEATPDWSLYDGHYYSNKAPGVSLLGVPALALSRTLRLSRWIREERFTNFFVSVVPAVALAVVFFFFLLARTTPMTAMYATIAYSLGTMALPYAYSIWGHQTAAAFLFFAYFALVQRTSPLWSGFWMSAAVLTEYSCAFTIPFFIIVLLRRFGARALVLFALGGLPGLFLFGLYHKSCFGGYLTLPQVYQNPEFRDLGPKLFGVLGTPKLKVFWDLFFDFKKGLFILSPVLIFAVLGMGRLLRQGTRREEVWLAFSVVCVFVGFNVCFNQWHGGWCIGPRYLIPMLPFLSVGFVNLKEPQISPLFLLSLLFSVSTVIAAGVIGTTAEPGHNLISDQIYPDLFKHDYLSVYSSLCLLAVAAWFCGHMATKSKY